MSFSFLQTYVSLYRPVAVTNAGGVESPFVFLSFKGKAFSDKGGLGKHLSSFLRDECKLASSTTALRSLVETTTQVPFILADDFNINNKGALQLKHRRGEIGADVVAAVHNINGHSSAVAANYYNRMDRVADVYAARSLFHSPIRSLPASLDEYHQDGSPPPASTPIVASTAAAIPMTTSFATHSTYRRQIRYGSDHPYYNNNVSKRIPWSDAEKEYLMAWKEAHILCPEDNEGALGRCLDHIKADVSCHPIFHQHHVLNTARLRNGFEQRARRSVRQEEL